MLLINFDKQSEISFKVIHTEYDKPLVMIKNDHEYFEDSTNCWISIKNIWERWSESKRSWSHDHITGKYWESMH